VHDAGEVFTGYSPAFVVFLQSDGGLSLPLKLFGLRSGWNALEIAADSPYPVALPLDSIPVVAPEPSTEATVSGTWTAPVTTGTPGPATWLGLVPASDYSGMYLDVLYDDPITPDWSITVTGEPPLTHQLPGNPYVAAGTALEVPVTFEDTDASGSLTPGDLILDSVCTADLRPVALAWFPATDDLLLTFVTQAQSGWVVVADPEGTLEILGTDLGELTIGGC
jgi:hypothetical protein